ncbi:MULTISPECIES: cell division ATP-binding protein FtsE [Thermaerobacter]|uniref:Cell division ATP-binding protein FtsE n=1 Tax=Thermaerobacter composti TaxID=554949 RepID=A0ABZ0QRD0_9FIRM|nr:MULTISPECIES: cell division ATP-binding protein FtsE [Thermaerobacter]PZN09444.1 MAG: cell division ATP-binding protein FtsE [Bacillota bacterium]QBS37234.1 cell division ATP-binding protein FtsE [Thermaerobacter sp. FW80]WPD19254.1 cell division ATP-binding protein FtsE [Thermaerobacter composti]
MIEFINVSKVYPNGVTALEDVSLHVERGEFVFLVGPSGAGKSTLVRLIYREETPTQGVVMVDGLNVGRLRRRDVPFLRRQMGVVFQDFKLLPNRTAYENVAFAMFVTGHTPRQIRRRVPEVLELVGLRDKAGALPSELSGGEQQRVAVARAVVNHPKILLADEPTGNLDPETAWGIMELLVEINRRGTTVLVATHAQTIVNALKRRVVRLEGGRIAADHAQGVYERAI